MHRAAGVVQEAPDGSEAASKPQAKPQPRVRQKLAKPEGPLKRQAQRKGLESGAAGAAGEGGAGTVSQQRRAAHKLALEQDILAAARELFAARGPEALTLREVAAAVGYSHATLYSFFADKGELLARLAADSLQGLLARLEGARDGAEPGQARVALVALARAFVQWGLQHPHDYRLLLQDPPAALREPLRAGLGALTPLPPARAAALWAGLHGLVMLELGGLAGLGAMGPGEGSAAARAQRLAALLDGLASERE